MVYSHEDVHTSPCCKSVEQPVEEKHRLLCGGRRIEWHVPSSCERRMSSESSPSSVNITGTCLLNSCQRRRRRAAQKIRSQPRRTYLLLGSPMWTGAAALPRYNLVLVEANCLIRLAPPRRVLQGRCLIFVSSSSQIKKQDVVRVNERFSRELRSVVLVDATVSSPNRRPLRPGMGWAFETAYELPSTKSVGWRVAGECYAVVAGGGTVLLGTV